MSPEHIEQARRFVLARIQPDANGCWRWTGNLNPSGYGRCSPAFIGRTVKAHRLSYEAFVGPIPEGLEIDHLCSVRDCVNPEHLDPCTRQENSHRYAVRRGQLAYANLDARIEELWCDIRGVTVTRE